MSKKLEGKIAVITGGSSGIGFATAKLFVEEGAYVFITGRRQKELDEAVKAIGGNVTGVQGDVAKLADVDRLYESSRRMGESISFSLTPVSVSCSLGSKLTGEINLSGGNPVHHEKGLH